MTQSVQQKQSGSTAMLAAVLAFGGILMLAAAIVLMTRLADQYAQHAVQTAPNLQGVATPIARTDVPTTAKTPPPTVAADSAATPVADSASAPVADSAATPVADSASAPVADSAATPVADSAADRGPWTLHLNPENNEPDAEGIKQIAAINAVLDADPKATVSLVGVNHFRKSSKRAQLAAQTVLERLRAHSAMNARRVTATGEQTADAEGLIVRATVHGGAK